MRFRVVVAGILLGLAAAAVVLAVVPPASEVLQVHHAVGSLPAGLATAPGLDADASALLGGRPDPAGIADAVTVTPGAGTFEVRARAATSDDAAVVAAAVGTVLDRRAAETAPTDAGAVLLAGRPAVLVADPPRDVGLRPQPAAVLGGGALVGLVGGLVAAGLHRRADRSSRSRSSSKG